jgi:phospholipase/carboxylesterase
MTRELQSARKAPKSGKAPNSAVIFLHGYGADGSDLLGLADPLGQHMRDTVFLAPNAPEPCANNPSQVILFGFSQGTMMSLQVAPRRDQAFAGVVGFSGRLIDPEKLKSEVTVKPPIMLIHGDRDDMVPFSSLQEAAEALVEEDFDVFTHVMEGTPHGISPDGLQQSYGFMAEMLGLRRS